MKKTFMLFAAMAVLLFGSSASAQEIGTAGNVNLYPAADIVPGLSNPVKPNSGSSKAMWDLLFNYNITTTTNSVGCAGVCYINGDIWVSKWQSDTLMRFTPAGVLIEKFQIAGLSGVRSMTTDGTYIYAGANTTTVYRINPATKLLAPPHITVADNARWITFDQSLNGNAGGFWYGNFSTDINAVDMSGNVLTTIPAATHGLTGMYGAAYDGASPGGPYLWIFNQGGANNCQIIALSLPAGTPTVYTRDAYADISTGLGLTSGLAGGLFLSTTISSGNIALMGVVQGTPNNGIFAYDLDINTGLIDAGVSDLRPTEGYTQIPVNQVFGETFTFTVTNNGTAALDSIYADVTISYNGTPVTNDLLTTTNLASAATFNFTTASFTPANGTGNYTVDVTIHTGAGQTDADATNDDMSFSFDVTDSVFARDNDVPDGGSGYAVSGTDWAYALTNFNLTVADTLNGVWIQLANPVAGDTTYAVVAHTTTGVPDAVIALGDVVIIGTDSAYFLEFPTPVALAAGLYSIGCYEGAISTINLAQSPELWTAGMNFFYTPTSGWTASGIQTARFIRPYFVAGDGSIGMREESMMENGISVFPNPSAGQFTITLPASFGNNATVNVFESTGRLLDVFSVSTTGTSAQIDLGAYPEGLYFIQIQSENTSTTEKVMISR